MAVSYGKQFVGTTAVYLAAMLSERCLVLPVFCRYRSSPVVPSKGFMKYNYLEMPNCLREAGVGGSNPLTPTTSQRARISAGRRVAAGSCPPATPTDPDVRNSRIRLLELRNRCTTIHTVYDAWGSERVAGEQLVDQHPVT